MGSPVYDGVQHDQSDEENVEEINICLKLIRTIPMKTMLNEKEGISECFQELFFSGDQIHDDSRLIDHGIQQNSTIDVFVQTSVPLMPITVKTPDGKILETEVNVLQTVSDLISVVESMAGFSLDDHCLTFNDEKLEDSKTLYYYNIQEQSVVEILCETTTIQVLITYVGGGGEGGIIRQVLEVSRSNSVKDLEDKIFHQMRIPVHEQLLMCDGKLLLNNNNDCNLASFNIQNCSTITLIGLMN